MGRENFAAAKRPRPQELWMLARARRWEQSTVQLFGASNPVPGPWPLIPVPNGDIAVKSEMIDRYGPRIRFPARL